MNDKFQILPGVVPPVSRTGQRNPVQGARSTGKPFAEILEQQLRPLRFSRHAQERMASRGIELSSAEMSRLGQAVSAVEAKGGRDSLIMLDDKALVVSVKNQTVVTVVDRDALKDNVFTNIDSAIIA